MSDAVFCILKWFTSQCKKEIKSLKLEKNPSYGTFKNQLENKGQEGQWVELQEGVSDAGESRWTWSTSKDRSPETQ